MPPPPSSSSPRPSLLRGLSLGPGVTIEEVPTERALFRRLQSLISTLDPDFLLGWEVRQGLVKQ